MAVREPIASANCKDFPPSKGNDMLKTEAAKEFLLQLVMGSNNVQRVSKMSLKLFADHIGNTNFHRYHKHASRTYASTVAQRNMNDANTLYQLCETRVS